MVKKEEKKSNKNQKTESVQKKKTEKLTFYQAVGRRKEATARVRLYVVPGSEITVGNQSVKKGDIVVNSRPIEKYFPGDMCQKFYLEPFRITDTIGRFAVTVLTKGGGSAGQLGAFIHGVSRAIEKVDKEKYRLLLKKEGFLTRDAREKERRKAGLAQKARAKKQSPKR